MPRNIRVSWKTWLCAKLEDDIGLWLLSLIPITKKLTSSSCGPHIPALLWSAVEEPVKKKKSNQRGGG